MSFVVVTVARALWFLAVVAVTDGGHALALRWEAGRWSVVRVHEKAKGNAAPHRHDLADRLLLVADEHADDAPHEVGTLSPDDVVPPRSELLSAAIGFADVTAAQTPSGPADAPVTGWRVHPPPARPPAFAPLRTIVLLI